MGYRDYKLALSTSQQVTADAVSENYIDTEQTYPKLGDGIPACVVITVEAKATAGTGVNFYVIHKTSQPTAVSDGPICMAYAPAADLAVGDTITIPLPTGITMLRYLALWYDVVAGTEDYTFSAYLSPSPTA